MCAAIILAVSSAHSLWSHDASVNLKEALRQDPASPYRGCDLAERFAEEGQREKARYCFHEALALAPNIPPIWMRAMFFYLQGEETAAALDSSARVPKVVPDYDEVIFNYYDRFVPTVAEVLLHLADNGRAAQIYFRLLLKSGTTEDVAVAWTWLRGRSFAQDQLAAGYLDFLLQHREFGEAVKVWASYLAARRGDYPNPNLIFNGDFENEPTGAALDWRIANNPGVDVNRDGHGARNGNYSLHMVFHGTENVNYGHTAQTVCIRPGKYRFRAFVRSCAQYRPDYRRGPPFPHLRSRIRRAAGCIYRAIDRDKRLDTTRENVQGPAQLQPDRGPTVPDSVLEVR
jgi:tetratricopeptide (TPR) repeat protein